MVAEEDVVMRECKCRANPGLAFAGISIFDETEKADVHCPWCDEDLLRKEISLDACCSSEDALDDT